MSRFWSPVVHTLSPYVPGEQPKQDGIVKLNTNENPYPPSPRVLAAIAAAAERLRLYPDPRRDARCARRSRAHYDVAPEEVFVGNGSDEVLAHTFQALLKHDAPLLFPDITYSFYPVYCRLYGVSYEEVPLDAAMRLQIADYRRPCSAILLANPNAPTGIALPRQAIEALLAEHPDQLVVVDEAYVDFGGESAVPLVARHDNLLVDPDPLQVAGAGGPARRLCHRPAAADRGAGAGEGQFQFLSARLPRHRGRGRGDRGRCVVSGDAPAHHGKPRIAGARSLPASASRCCRRRRILCSRAIPAAAAPNSPQACASAAYWCGISRSRGSRISCASRSEPTSSAAA